MFPLVLDKGARCYVAFLDDLPGGYGWVGTKVGHVREVGLVTLFMAIFDQISGQIKWPTAG